MAKLTKDFISFQNISKSFSDNNGIKHHIFKDFSLNIQRHEFVSILGPSGCGKSTLLRLVSGLIPYDSGKIIIDQQFVNQATGNTSFVFQKPTLLPWLDLNENILFPLKHRHGRVKEEDRERAKKLLELINLSSYAGKKPNQLSGGMQQRVAIARALIQEKDILLMDEPFSALDAMNRERLGFELLKLLEPKPRTVLFVTHSIAEAVMLSDRVLVLSTNPVTNTAAIVDSISINLDEKRSLATLNNPLFNEYSSRIRSHFYKGNERDACA